MGKDLRAAHLRKQTLAETVCVGAILFQGTHLKFAVVKLLYHLVRLSVGHQSLPQARVTCEEDSFQPSNRYSQAVISAQALLSHFYMRFVFCLVLFLRQIGSI